MFQGPSLLSLRLFGLIAYMLLMLAAVRPLSRLIVERLRPDVLSAELLGMTLVTVLLSAAATDAIGVHPPFALLNTRGLVELIVLNVGYSAGMLSPEVFTMFVIMALLTTMMTTPILGLLGVDSRLEHHAILFPNAEAGRRKSIV
jgi:Kef-type K+ transport system membrane component KefB